MYTPSTPVTLPVTATTTPIDAITHAQAAASITQAFNADPVNYASVEMPVAIHPATLHPHPDDDHMLHASAGIDYYTCDDQENIILTTHTIDIDYRVIPITNTHCVVEARRKNRKLDNWVKTSRVPSRNADKELISALLKRSSANHYLALPRIVEDYVGDTLGMHVLDGRSLYPLRGVHAAPFALDIENYTTIHADYQWVCENMSDDAVWKHYHMHDLSHTEHADLRFVPTHTLHAFATATTAKALATALFGTRATRNVIRAVGASNDFGPIIAATLLTREETPADWIAHFIEAFQHYDTLVDDTGWKAYDLFALLTQLRPFFLALPTRDYMRIIKPLALAPEHANHMSVKTFTDVAGKYRNNINQYASFPIDVVNAVLFDIAYTKHARNLKQWIECLDHHIWANIDTQPLPMTAEEFNAWCATKRGMRWCTENDSDWVQRYINTINAAHIFEALTHALDGSEVQGTDYTLHVAHSTAEYVEMGQTLKNCLTDYTYQPHYRIILRVCKTTAANSHTLVGAVEICANDTSVYTIEQIRGLSNACVTNDKLIRKHIDDVAHHVQHTRIPHLPTHP